MSDERRSIEIEKINDNKFKVLVKELETSTEHKVTVGDQYYLKLTQGHITRVELMRLSFGYLLQRQSKESIPPCFDLSAIPQLFPEYEEDIAV